MRLSPLETASDAVISSLESNKTKLYARLISRHPKITNLLNSEQIKFILAPSDAAIETFLKQHRKSPESLTNTPAGQAILENHVSSIFNTDDPTLAAINGIPIAVDKLSISSYHVYHKMRVGDVRIMFIGVVIVNSQQLSDFNLMTPIKDPLDWSHKMTLGKCNRLSVYMRLAINQILTRQDLIYYASHPGDSVKNTGLERYDHLTPEFKALSYDEKIRALKQHGLRESGGIGFKQWPLQQWGKNAMRYAKLANKHLLYIQSDLWYCAYPSMFAEAMYSSGILTSHKYYPGSGFHFFGPSMDLFCVGDWNIELEIRALLPRNVQILHAEQREWLNIEDRLLFELYSSGRSDPDWLSYQPEIYPNINKPTRTHNGTIKTISGQNIVFRNAQTIGDLNNAFVNDEFYGRYIINKVSVNSTVTNLPLSWIPGDATEDLSIYGVRHMSANPTAKYKLNEDVIYAGTLNLPIGIIDGVAYPLV